MGRLLSMSLVMLLTVRADATEQEKTVPASQESKKEEPPREKDSPQKRAAGDASGGSVGPSNSIYVEALGSALLYSVNCDRVLFRPASSIALVGRVGLMYAPGYSSTYGFPLMTGAMIGSGKHRFELGGGHVFGKGYDLVFPPGWTVIVGYRFQPTKRGFLFRASLTELVSKPDRFGYRSLITWPGVSFGWAF